jgi:hypothetical protein
MEDEELLAAIRWQLQQISSNTAVNGAEKITAKKHKRRRGNG